MYRRKLGHEGSEFGEREVEAFDTENFFARVIMYIPESRSHLVRYYGWYSNVSRAKRQTAGRVHEKTGGAVSGPPSPTARAEARDVHALRRCWAQFIKRIYEIDPLVCP